MYLYCIFYHLYLASAENFRPFLLVKFKYDIFYVYISMHIVWIEVYDGITWISIYILHFTFINHSYVKDDICFSSAAAGAA